MSGNIRQKGHTVFVWKHEDWFKACFIYSNGLRGYLVMNDEGEDKDEMNERINNWAFCGHDVKVGLPPPPPPLKSRKIGIKIEST